MHRMGDWQLLLIWSLWVAGAYAVGSIPFGLLLGLARGVDIRTRGSGNVGATNAGRVLGRTWGILCFVLDVGKGLAPVLAFGLIFYAQVEAALRGALGDDGGGPALAALAWLAVGAAAVAGHVFPVYLRFKGGKGVATGLGVVLGLWPVVTVPGLIAGVLWLGAVALTRYVSVGSIMAAVSLPVATVISALVLGLSAGEVAVYGGVTALLAALVVLRHRSNLAKLRAGTEPKVSWFGGNA